MEDTNDSVQYRYMFSVWKVSETADGWLMNIVKIEKKINGKFQLFYGC